MDRTKFDRSTYFLEYNTLARPEIAAVLEASLHFSDLALSSNVRYATEAGLLRTLALDRAARQIATRRQSSEVLDRDVELVA
jgi:hypothetical protein